MPFKVNGFGDLFSTDGSPAPTCLPFSYRMRNGGNLSNGPDSNPNSIWLLTWNNAPMLDVGSVGYPICSLAPHQWGAGNDMAAFIDSHPNSGTTDFDWGTSHDTVPADSGKWDLSSQWDRLDADPSSKDKCALLHSFTAWGTPGIAYLVDLVGVLPYHVSQNSATDYGVLPISPATVTSVMRRPRARGSKFVQSLAVTGGGWESEYGQSLTDLGGAMGYNSFNFTAGGRPPQEGDTSRAYSPSVGGGVANIMGGEYYQFSGRASEGWDTQHQPWSTGPGGISLSINTETGLPYTGTGGNPSLQVFPGAVEMAEVRHLNGAGGQTYFFIDVLATLEITSAFQSSTMGLPSQDVIKIASRSNLGILFQRNNNTTATYPLMGRVNLII